MEKYRKKRRKIIFFERLKEVEKITNTNTSFKNFGGKKKNIYRTISLDLKEKIFTVIIPGKLPVTWIVSSYKKKSSYLMRSIFGNFMDRNNSWYFWTYYLLITWDHLHTFLDIWSLWYTLNQDLFRYAGIQLQIDTS